MTGMTKAERAVIEAMTQCLPAPPDGWFWAGRVRELAVAQGVSEFAVKRAIALLSRKKVLEKKGSTRDLRYRLAFVPRRPESPTKRE